MSMSAAASPPSAPERAPRPDTGKTWAPLRRDAAGDYKSADNLLALANLPYRSVTRTPEPKDACARSTALLEQPANNPYLLSNPGVGE